MKPAYFLQQTNKAGNQSNISTFCCDSSVYVVWKVLIQTFVNNMLVFCTQHTSSSIHLLNFEHKILQNNKLQQPAITVQCWHMLCELTKTSCCPSGTSPRILRALHASSLSTHHLSRFFTSDPTKLPETKITKITIRFTDSKKKGRMSFQQIK